MITQLNPQDPVIAPGKQVNVYRYHLRSFRLHKMLETASILCIALLECDSNNTAAEVSARDTRNFQLSLDSIAREWDWAKKHKDAPKGSHELIFTINFPTPEEVQGMKNGKLKSVALELYNFFHVVLGSQAADQQMWVGPQSEGDVDDALDILREIVTVLLGTGAQDSGTFDVGVLAPDFSYIGQLAPSPSEVSPTIAEPSKDAQPPKVPDVPDVP